jgi:hypothetical protein
VSSSVGPSSGSTLTSHACPSQSRQSLTTTIELATPPGSPIKSDSETPSTPGKWFGKSPAKPKTTENLSRRQRKNRCKKRNRQQALLESRLTGTIDHRHEQYLNRRAGQLENRSKRLFREGLQKAKVAAKIIAISEKPLRSKFKSAEESLEYRNNISARKESRELLEKAHTSAAFALRYRSAVILHGSGQTNTAVAHPSSNTTKDFKHKLYFK